MMVLVVTAVGIQIGSSEMKGLRPLNTDRPDATESPFTVDEGHFQMEVEMASVTFGGSGRVTSGEVECGIILPLGIEGGDGWGYGLQAEVDVVADKIGTGHHFEFLAFATAAHGLTEKTGFFVELVGIMGEGAEAGTEAYFNTGLTYAMAERVQLDGGVRVGLTNDSDDFTPFFGISAKF